MIAEQFTGCGNAKQYYEDTRGDLVNAGGRLYTRGDSHPRVSGGATFASIGSAEPGKKVELGRAGEGARPYMVCGAENYYLPAKQDETSMGQ